MTKKTILVTGGAGFIGADLIRELLKQKDHVICMDDLFSGRYENIQEYLNDPHFEFIDRDVTEPVDIQCDCIYHLACPASPVFYEKSPVDTIKTCFLGSLNMLELAKKYHATILLSSTSEIYGDPLVHPQTEGYLGNVNTLGPRSCYDEGKRSAETLFYDYHLQYGVNIKIVRIFNTYGPGMRADDGRVISNFITQALENRPITIYGDGSQTRSFCYIEDTVRALISMMDTDKAFIGPVNVGNPCEKTMTELAEYILKLTGSVSEIVYKDLPKDDPVKRSPDISLAKKKLGWTPCISLEEGLLKTIEYFKQQETHDDR